MLPSISPLSNPNPSHAEVAIPPPLRFRAPVGEIRDVRLKVNEAECDNRRGNTSAKHGGILYERKVQRHFKSIWPSYLSSPCLHFVDDSGARTCIPDGLLIRTDRTIIFEIKSQHMPEAWWQLRRLYQPVVQALYPLTNVQCIEVVRSFDVAMPFPSAITLIHDIEEHVKLPITNFGVYIWRPSR